MAKSAAKEIAAKDPGTVLKLFLDEYQLNPSKLGKEVELSQSTIRQITLNKMKISIPIALRFAKFFGNPVEFWIDLQTKHSLIEAAEDNELNEVLNKINKVEKPAPTPKAAKITAPKSDEKKGAASDKAEKKEKEAKPSTPKAEPKSEKKVRQPRGKKAK